MFYLTASQESGPEQRTHTVGAVWGTESDQFLFFWRILGALWRPKKKKKRNQYELYKGFFSFFWWETNAKVAISF
jgi:hypothetical protein